MLLIQGKHGWKWINDISAIVNDQTVWHNCHWQVGQQPDPVCLRYWCLADVSPHTKPYLPDTFYLERRCILNSFPVPSEIRDYEKTDICDNLHS